MSLPELLWTQYQSTTSQPHVQLDPKPSQWLYAEPWGQGLGPGIFSRGCPAYDAVWPKAQGGDRISKLLSTISAGFESGSLQALIAVLVFHPVLQHSVQTTAPVTSHIPWHPPGASTEKGCKGEERLFWVLNSAKEENCPMGIEGRESYKVNGSFHTRMQETTGLCTSCLNGVVGLSRASLKEGLHQCLKGVIQLLADDSQVSVSMFYISCLWSATLLLHHWLFLLCFSFKGFVLLLIHAS